MSVDPYALCPCGSGKKIKFCCQPIIAEMEKVERLLENNQPRMALQILEKLLPAHSQNSWVVLANGWALLADHRHADAKAALAQFLRHHPEHPSANALHALAAFEADGLPACKKAIHRAFRRSFRAEPAIVCGLAASMGNAFLEMGHVLAARQHLALLLLYGEDEDRKRAVQEIAILDSDTEFPYALRGVHPTPRHEPPEPLQAAAAKAHRLSALGCWAEAAEIYTQIVEQTPESAEAWHTLALFHAWDGNEAGAASALHRAGRLYADFETAVECETLAQLVEPLSPEERVLVRSRAYTLTSVGQALTALDAADAVERVSDPRSAPGPQHETAMLVVLDRPAPDAKASLDLTWETCPRQRGSIVLYDKDPDDAESEALAVLNAVDGEPFETVERTFLAACGAMATKATKNLSEEEIANGITRRAGSREGFSSNSLIYTHASWPQAVVERIDEEQARHHREVEWPQAPLRALGGRSPQEVRGQAEYRVALAAAINLLELHHESRGRILSVDEVRTAFDLPPAAPLELGPEDNINVLSFAQLSRIDTRSLNDERFTHVLRRVLTSRRLGCSQKMLREYVEQRQERGRQFPAERANVYKELVRIALRQGRADEILHWIREAQKHPSGAGHDFEELVNWKIHEFSQLSREPSNPEFRKVLDELWFRFAPKLPKLRDLLEESLAALGVERPGEGIVIAGEAALASADPRRAGGVLEPASAAADEKKLWLPGMD